MAPMKKSDELDRAGSAAYAWRLYPPGDAVPALDAAPADEDTEDSAPAQDLVPPPWLTPAPHESGDERELDEWRRKVSYGAAALADAVDRAWTMSPDPQLAAVTALLSEAEQLGIGLCAMMDHPLQSVRLLRLAVRWMARLSPDAQQTAGFAASWLDFEHPEVIDLLVEVALAEQAAFGGSLMIAFVTSERGKRLARVPGASSRFARLLDEGPSNITRRVATDWLRLAARRDAVPALRRALRLPHFVLRYRAFDILESDFPDAVEPDDVVFLLEEAVIHPPPEIGFGEEMYRATAYFPEKLEGAVTRLRPPGAVLPLRRIAQDRCAQKSYRMDGFDSIWALGALAAAFPEEAAPLIDELQRHIEWDRRFMAAEGAGKLPDEMAWPRLLVAAADGVPEVAERAHERWLQRRGALCPLDELAGVETALLDSPPDDRFRSRLSLLRRAPLAARAAMVEVLFAEAPDPAALALLLFAAIDSGLWERKPRPGLPENRRAYCARIVTLFGARGVTGVCALARRYAGRRWDWFDALSDVAARGELPAETHAIVRDAAAERFLSSAEHGRLAPLTLLVRLGPPPSCVERIWKISQDPAEPDHMRSEAANALAALTEGAPRLASIVVAALESSLREGDLGRFARAAAVGLRLKVAAALALVERFVAERSSAALGDRALTAALRECTKELRTLGRLPDDWQIAALKQTGTQAFAVAAQYRRAEASPQLVAALRAALRSPDPESAGEAARALLLAQEIEPEDPALRAIAARASPAVRAEILGFLLLCGTPDAAWWPWLEEALLSPDPEVTGLLRDRLTGLDRDGAMRERLRSIRTKIIDPVLADQVQDFFEQEDIAAFWQDSEAEYEDEEDDELDDEDLNDPEVDKLF